jgi:hypothetical protein
VRMAPGSALMKSLGIGLFGSSQNLPKILR